MGIRVRQSCRHLAGQQNRLAQKSGAGYFDICRGSSRPGAGVAGPLPLRVPTSSRGATTTTPNAHIQRLARRNPIRLLCPAVASLFHNRRSGAFSHHALRGRRDHAVFGCDQIVALLALPCRVGHGAGATQCFHAHGTCETAMNEAIVASTSAAKDSAKLALSRNRNPSTGGRIGGTGAPAGGLAISDETDSPLTVASDNVHPPDSLRRSNAARTLNGTFSL